MTEQLSSLDVLSPWRSIRVDPGIQVALWVQLKSQIQYLISTGVVSNGTKLPAVRTFAGEINVAIDTVRRAYEELQREGLVKTEHGRGTFVSRPGEDSDRLSLAQAEWARVDGVLMDAAQRGIDLLGSSSRIAQRLALVRHGVSVVFVGRAASAQRNAQAITEAAGLSSPVQTISIESLRSGDADFAGFTYAVCLIGHHTEVSNRLQYDPVRVMPMTTRLNPGLFDSIPEGNNGRRVILVTLPETRANYLRILAEERPDLTEIDFVEDGSEELLRERLSETDLVLHTSVSRDMVTRTAGGTHRLIELTHAPTRESLKSISQELQADLSLQQALISPTPIAQAATARPE